MTIVTKRALAAVAALTGLLVLAVALDPVRTWLLRPWDGTADHRLPAWTAWHGRLMVFGWAICVPVGALIARYFKIWPGQDWPRQLDDKHWWHLHRALQICGIAAATGGLWLAWRNAGGASPLARWHAVLGWGIMSLGWGQIVGGMLRGTKGGPTDPRATDLHGDHYMMTSRRIFFEHAHKLSGYTAVILVVVVVPMGLALADAPRWMWLIIALWWITLASTAVGLQRAGRCIDTYQAIWGRAAELPGNRRRPIGWGIARPPGGGAAR